MVRTVPRIDANLGLAPLGLQGGRCLARRMAALDRTARLTGHKRKGSFRRVSPIAVRPGEGPFTERAAGVRPVHREQVLIRLEAEHFSRRPQRPVSPVQ
jgi:hypothetical protein